MGSYAIGKRQNEAKYSAVFRTIVGPYLAAIGLDYGASDGQAESGAGRLGCVERVENSAELIVRMPPPVSETETWTSDSSVNIV